MPKFRTEYKSRLEDILRLFRIEDAFDEYEAEFSALQTNVYVSEMVQKASFEISGGETEATAAFLARMTRNLRARIS